MLFVKKTPVKKENNVTIKGGTIMNGSLLFQPAQNTIKRKSVENVSTKMNPSNSKTTTKTHIEFSLRKDNHFTVNLPQYTPVVNISTPNVTSTIYNIQDVNDKTFPISRSSKIETVSIAPPSLEPNEIKQWIEENIQKKYLN